MNDQFPNLSSFLEKWLPNAWPILDEFIVATIETLYMLILTILFAGLLGLMLGVVIVVTGPKGILKNQWIYQVLDSFINIFRSIPFIILLALLVPFTRMLVNTSIGPTAAAIPIIVGTIPFFARQVEIALLEVDEGIVEAAQAMGSSPWDIIWRVYIREGLGSLLRVSASTVINVIGLTAMAGVVAGGGLGTVAIARGYQRSRFDVVIVATLLILLIVLISQLLFNWLIRKAEKHKRKY
ncbi:methionine ABC transporter permease [Facklamia sp. P12945]|uniref:methionine ABC transporter permease n=1 Tax=unclassified Facklamia TaxID=2622293 RepID=UPI003D17DB5A